MLLVTNTLGNRTSETRAPDAPARLLTTGHAGPTHVRTDRAGLADAVRRAFRSTSVPGWNLTLPPDGKPARGVVIAVHGGAWVGVGPNAMKTMHHEVHRWAARGFAVVNIDYHAGAASLHDVGVFTSAVRSWQGGGVPVGLIGASAGGHLALLTAERRRDIEFVVAEAAPTDIDTLGGTPNAAGVRRRGQSIFKGPLEWARSPLKLHAQLGAKLLMGTARNDSTVPIAQQDAMVRAHRGAVGVRLEPGADIPFVHTRISRAEYHRFVQAEDALVAHIPGARTRPVAPAPSPAPSQSPTPSPVATPVDSPTPSPTPSTTGPSGDPSPVPDTSSSASAEPSAESAATPMTP